MSFNYTDLAGLFIVVIGLIVTWKSFNARWLFIILIALQLFEVVTHPYTIKWTQHYYIWLVAMGVTFFTIILCRAKIANWLYDVTSISFFKQSCKQYNLTLPECSFLLFIFIAEVFHLAVWVEIQLYVFKVIQTPYLYSYVWETFQIFIQVMEICALITYIINERRQIGHISYETC